MLESPFYSELEPPDPSGLLCLLRFLDPEHYLLHREGQRLHLSLHQRHALGNPREQRSRQDGLHGKRYSRPPLLYFRLFDKLLTVSSY